MPPPHSTHPSSPLPPRSRLLQSLGSCSRGAVTSAASSPSPSPPGWPRPLRYAVLGAGFAGLSVAWHLLKQSPKYSRVSVDVYDENGVGGGASGVSGGLLHPYSPKAKLLWRGGEFWKESMDLLRSAEKADGIAGSDGDGRDDEALIWRRQSVFPCS
ncbi:unnamed protein product [Triticum turgidum subsp. durum]|uniref:FAD dependent oxidoreductase domain-containing protein n=1 Tax=Triticum turgidum subsp. durum TaxID=4567 RepID=A0A9R0ZSY0_TRITD|nr:unnamed protein product [Triticum turgidum subsp. durum]